jgi:putative FmdB family regulatory protein
MLYDYICESCNHESVDVQQSIKDSPKKVCPSCKKHKLRRVFSTGIGGFVKGGSGTVGSLADANAKANSSQINEMESKKKESRPQKEKRWFDNSGSATPKDISSMSKKQKSDYIMKGKR